ncbi:MAG: hypothetical protein OXE96_00675 [Gemmatimonadetes bacterium]|nr:hypothetical protein [Gemmatimonadota bacterium]
MRERRVPPGWPTLPRRRLLVVAAILVSAGAGGCASGSSEDSIPASVARRTLVSIDGYIPVELVNEAGVGTMTIPAKPELVWGVLGGVYGQLDIPVEASNARTMEIGNTGYRPRRVGGDRMSTFFNCGNNMTGRLADQYEVTLSVITVLTAREPDSTQVRSVVDASARPREVSGNRIHCASRGVLELRIAQLVAEALGLGS